MALQLTHKDSTFSVGDVVAVHQKITDGDKERIQIFEGMIIKVRGRGENKSFTIRRIGAQNIGIEKIFPLMAPVIEKIEVIRHGLTGSRRSKLYFVRDKSKREIEKIYSRTKRKELAQETKPAKKKKTPSPKK